MCFQIVPDPSLPIYLFSFSFPFLPVFLPSFKLMESCCLLTLQLQLRRFWTSYRGKKKFPQEVELNIS